MFSVPQKIVNVTPDLVVTAVPNYDSGLMLLVNKDRFERHALTEINSIMLLISKGATATVALSDSYHPDIDFLIVKFNEESFAPIGAFPTEDVPIVEESDVQLTN